MRPSATNLLYNLFEDKFFSRQSNLKVRVIALIIAIAAGAMAQPDKSSANGRYGRSFCPTGDPGSSANLASGILDSSSSPPAAWSTASVSSPSNL